MNKEDLRLLEQAKKLKSELETCLDSHYQCDGCELESKCKICKLSSNQMDVIMSFFEDEIKREDLIHRLEVCNSNDDCVKCKYYEEYDSDLCMICTSPTDKHREILLKILKG